MTIKQKNHTAFNIAGTVYSYIAIAIIICVLAFILIITFAYGWGTLSLKFLTTEPNPSALDTESGGILTPIIGTIILTVTGIVIAFPFALATAIYLCFYAKKGIFKTLVKSAVDILAGIPTIVIALFALVIFTLPQMGFLSVMIEVEEVGDAEAVETVGDIYGEQEVDSWDDGEWDNWGDWSDDFVFEGIDLYSLDSFDEADDVYITDENIIDEQIFDEPVAEIKPVKTPSRAYGRSFLVAGITMAIMILPFVIKSMEEALKSVPRSYIDAALALGATKWRTIYKIVLNSARDGLITGTILGMGRIIGDTAIVWLTLGGGIRMTGNQPWFSPENWLSTLKNGGCTLTSYIYYTSPAGEGNRFDVAFGASLVLIAIIILLNLAATIVGKAGEIKHE